METEGFGETDRRDFLGKGEHGQCKTPHRYHSCTADSLGQALGQRVSPELKANIQMRVLDKSDFLLPLAIHLQELVKTLKKHV